MNEKEGYDARGAKKLATVRAAAKRQVAFAVKNQTE